MCIYNSNEIQKTITCLKNVKASSFNRKNDSLAIKRAMETCRIVDTFMLPLYFIWEYCCHRQLNEIKFEEYLKKPYQRFIKTPITYTWEMFIYINLCTTPFVKRLGKKNIIGITVIYKKFLDNSDKINKQS